MTKPQCAVTEHDFKIGSFDPQWYNFSSFQVSAQLISVLGQESLAFQGELQTWQS
jgi:hypothetical protein